MVSSTPFSKILIANRGEIALRVMRTAVAMGYHTVAVFSDADRNAPHVVAAHQAVYVGAAPSIHSYLNVAAIIAAAKATGADAVHPGYGFLAENPTFAQAILDAGLVFIGPSPAAIMSMGNKAGAKRLMQSAGVPCIAGYQGEDQSESGLIAAANAIGFPLMIKATAGGGGRGMRLVSRAKEFADALRSAKSEARGAFGSDEVILEQAIKSPRHIEIQVVADRSGSVIHLGERDCSIQRRHQKVIEEAPSPAVNAELRRSMGATAVAAAKAIRYEGVGTFEFLLDRDSNFFFMEMNTRLQVEHPVTEAITGLDLVELQLRIAAGEDLRLKQDDINFSGHSIEVRLCAESPTASFMPQSGRMVLWRAPQNTRVESALFSGAEISPFYDSMIAKIISCGATREDARRKILFALDETVALGIDTNQIFIQHCLAHADFAAGLATTSFIGDHLNELLEPDSETPARTIAIGAVLLYVTLPASCGLEGTLRSMPINLHLTVDSRLRIARVTQVVDGFSVYIDEHHFDVSIEGVDSPAVRLKCDGIHESVTVLREEAALWFHYRGKPYFFKDETHCTVAKAGAMNGDGKVRASMNGVVVALHVQVGMRVTAGQSILTLEAMKMEHVHTAPISGKITAINVTVGEQVTGRRIVAEIELGGVV